MARLVLHLGRSKTGSTLLQEFLALNRVALAAAGVTVPSFFASSNHGELALAFSRTPGKLARAQAIKGEDDRRRLRQRLAHKLRANVRSGSTWLMTSEHLSSRVRAEDEIEALCAFLGQFFDEIHAVAYLRRPDHLAPSLFAEAVKAGRTKPLNAAFVEQRRRSFDHAAFLAQWTGVLGAEHVIGRPYVESFKARPTELVSDLLAVVARGGLPLDGDRRWVWPDRPLNQSLSAEGTAFLRLVNPHVPEGALTQSQRRALISEVRQRCPGVPVTLTPAAARALTRGELLTGGLDRDDWADDARWAEWFDAAPAPVAAMAVPPPRRLVALMAELSAPQGPIHWGGRRVPGWVPEGAVDAARTAAVRMLRR